jgi:hypothetical protein
METNIRFSAKDDIHIRFSIVAITDSATNRGYVVIEQIRDTTDYCKRKLGDYENTQITNEKKSIEVDLKDLPALVLSLQKILY